MESAAAKKTSLEHVSGGDMADDLLLQAQKTYQENMFDLAKLKVNSRS